MTDTSTTLAEGFVKVKRNLKKDYGSLTKNIKKRNRNNGYRKEVPFYCGVSITVALVIPQAYSSL